MANAPVQAVQGQPQQGAPAANPLGKLNQILGLNIGAPYQGSAMRQATDALPANVQVAGALGEQQDQQKAAIFAQRMQESGGMPVPGSPDFAQRSQAAKLMYDQIYGQQQPGNPMGAFGQPSTSYAPTGLRGRVLAAGGQEVQGIGGAMVSATPNAQGGNSFMLRQGAQQSQFIPPSQPMQAQVPAGPSAAAMQFLQDGIDPNVMAPPPVRQEGMAGAMPPAQPGASPIAQAQGQYQQAIAAMNAPRKNVEPGFEPDPNKPGAVRPVEGGSVDLKQKEAAQKEQLRQRQSAESAQLVIGAIDTSAPLINAANVGPAAVVNARIPGTDAYNLANTLDTIKANIGFDRLQEMRAASPTGGALGQVAVKELEFLQAVRGSLNQNQSPAQLKKNLGQVRKHYERFVMANSGYDPESPNDRKAFMAAGGVTAAEGQPVASTAAGPIKITSIRRID